MEINLDVVEYHAENFFKDILRDYRLDRNKVFSCILKLDELHTIDYRTLDKFIIKVQNDLKLRDNNVYISAYPLSDSITGLEIAFSLIKSENK